MSSNLVCAERENRSENECGDEGEVESKCESESEEV